MAKATTNGKEHYTQLEQRLVLLRWLCHQLGYADNREALADTKSVAEGFGADGRSYLYHHLLARGSKVKIDSTDLARYDENIRMHLARLNRRRTTPITLRYFQHLAALYTEIFLDRLFTDRHGLLCDLNSFVDERNVSRRPGEVEYPRFTESDLNKLAYWMATGSGKTLLMHLNYYQFLHYNKEPLSNILLITPNEGLSEQHLAELQASGIPARRFDLKAGGLWASDPNTVQVIEITKLVEQKSGGGVSVPVEAFEGRNLIFVDEGHKGAGGEAWRKYRDALGENGFTFEYSATFGQALSAAGNDALTQEYSKAIIFDYSYRYFYNDGFGKDFYILNLRSNDDLDTTHRLLMGNLLTFYEQLRLYEEQESLLRPYNLEKPLLVFIGSTVNAVYKESKKPRSDVLTVARFLHRVLADPDWAVQTIGNLLAGQSGLALANGQDAFGGRFVYLRQKGHAANPATLYNDLLKSVFHARGSSGLYLCELSRSAGELGLKAGPEGKYFGVISIGDVSEFKKLVEAETPQELKWEQDAISPSLFEQINAPDSSLHILIGAKKFIEGWNSWRVSSMGLLNIGKQEGSQIIQLFGRGVRLKGLGMSLKRSAALEGNHPKHLRLLETLNIFAVRANYMQLFREYLEREGVEVEPPLELSIPVAIQKEHLRKCLLIPRPPKDKDFITETALLLEADSNSVRLDLSTKLQVLQSNPSASSAQAQAQSVKPQQIPAQILDLVDWERVYLELLAYKTRKGFTNLVIRPEKLRAIVAQGKHDVVVDSGVNLTPNTLDDLERLQDIVTRLLCRYMDKFYQTRREQWEAQQMQLYPLDESDPNLSFNLREAPTGTNRPTYLVRIPRSKDESEKQTEDSFIKQILQLLEQEHKLYCTEEGELSRIYFDRHIYIPLLLEQKGLQVSPPGLAPSEEQFVRDLRAFWEQEKCGLLAGKELFLLRNLSRGKGIGFFEGRGFYPDFILWILEPNRKHQRIVFIEPHGMVYAKAYIHDEKAHLHEYLRTLSQQLPPPSNGWTVELDSYLVSATLFDELRKRYDDGTWDRAKFARHHILFPERNGGYDYLRSILVPPPQSAPALPQSRLRRRRRRGGYSQARRSLRQARWRRVP
jgi:hypothetical protein